MKKRIFSSLFAICLVLLLLPLQVYAVNPIDVSRPCSLRVEYSYDQQAFPGQKIALYRVADCFADGTWELSGDFAGDPVNIHGITSQTEWRQATSTLLSYAAADQRTPFREGVTDSAGQILFENLTAGMYLIPGVLAESSDGNYQFEAFLVVLPHPAQEGDHLYDVTSKPKCSHSTPTPETRRYTLVKHWKDTGYESSRPESVTVDILNNGQVVMTQQLTRDNNWSFSWDVLDDGSIWQVVERNVPAGYTVTATREGNTFLLTNTRSGGVVKPPQTGDPMIFWPYILIMCISGCALLLLGIHRRRLVQ